MKTLSMVLLSCLVLPLFACQTTQTETPTEKDAPEEGGGVNPTPGGDCVLNVNPQNTLPGPSFSVGYDVDGNKTISNGKTNYSFEIDSKYDVLEIGHYSGSDRPTLDKNVAYALRIEDFDSSPSAFVYEINNPFGTQEPVDWGQADTDLYKTKEFTIAVEDYASGGTAYVRLVVTTGANALYFDLNETAP